MYGMPRVHRASDLKREYTECCLPKSFASGQWVSGKSVKTCQNSEIVEIKNELAQIYGPIGEYLQTVERRLYDLVPPDLEPISTVEKYILDNGGKRLRPALVLLSAKAMRSPTDSDKEANFAQSPSEAPLSEYD